MGRVKGKKMEGVVVELNAEAKATEGAR